LRLSRNYPRERYARRGDSRSVGECAFDEMIEAA
jgi:hypothetical protein